MNLELFVAKQLELLELERDAEIEENRYLHESSSMKDLQKKGVSIPKLRLASSHTGLFGRFINTFEPFWPRKPLPCHNIRSGDIVGIGHLASDGKRKIIASGVVTHVKEENISVALEKGSEEFCVMESDMQYLIIKLANDVTYKRLKKALKHLNQERSERNSRLIDTLFGYSKPCCMPIINSIMLFNTNLNEMQCDAVKFALSQEEVSLLHGPPGTGKTTTVVEIIMQAVAQKLKVLACAPSNVAVDNLVEKLSNYKVKMTRLGHPARFLPAIHKYTLDAVVSKYDGSRITDDLRREIDQIKLQIEKSKEGTVRSKLWAQNKLNLKELKDREKTVISEVLKQVDVVLCTLTSASSDGPIKHLRKEHFDIVVIDECSQALEASCWISLTRAPRCILAGDHHQLPPTIISDKAAKDGLAETLMERLIKLHGNDIFKMLKIQYRMHQKIMEWPSKQLYDGKLEAHESVRSHLLRDILEVEDDENTAVPLLFIDTAGCNLDELDAEDEESKGNEGEADLVTCHVENLVKSGVKASDIAVITPYNLQVDLIKSRLSSKYPCLEIKSVDGFQGREKEAVVLSLVRSNPKGEVGFLTEDRRINVAITRAKRHLAVICNSETVSHHPFLKSFVDYISSEGEVRSASLYEDEIECYPKLLSQSVEPYKAKLSENNCKSKRTEKPSLSKVKTSTCKQNITKDIPEKTEQLDDHLNSTVKDCRAAKSEEFRTILKLFLENIEESVLKFSPQLNAFERRIVHEVSEEFGLLHISQGEDTGRYIEVKKIKTVGDVENCCVDKFCVIGERLSDSVCDINRRPLGCTHNATSKETLCPTCGKSIPADNFELHSIHCKDVVIKEKKNMSSKAKVKGMVNKNKTSVIPNTNVLSDADFDAIIEETIKSNNMCAQDKCKKSVSTLGQECQFCRSRFCYSHFMPEVHGCGDAAKSHARHQLRKEGNLYPGSEKPQKSSNDVKHAQLQRKLSKKLTDLSNQRKAKPKN